MTHTIPATLQWRWTLRASSTAALGALIFVIQLYRGLGTTSDLDVWDIALSAAIACFLVTLLLWWLLIVRKQRLQAWRGVLTGGLVGLLGLPMTWYILALYFYATGAQSSLGQPTLNPLEAIFGSLILGLASVYVVGWMTIPLGMLGGWLFFLLYRWRVLRTLTS